MTMGPSLPTTHVFVPSSVNGPGLRARTRTTAKLPERATRIMMAAAVSKGPLSRGISPGNLLVAMCAKPSPNPGSMAGLTDRLRARIQAQGPLTFAEFMEVALYDPEDGFYSRPAVGAAGDFVTSPHVSPVFGILLATQVEEYWRLLGRPEPFAVGEVGAGDGTLSSEVLGSLPPAIRDSAHYLAVDRSPGARESLKANDVSVAAELTDVVAGLVGCILANELLDNLPFHRLRRTAHGLVEVYVGWEGGRFVLEEGPLSS